MSRKRKLSNRKISIKPKSPMESVGMREVSPMTIRDCAEKLAGEEMRDLLVELIYSQIQMLDYLGSTGLSIESYLNLYEELIDLGLTVSDIPKEALDYLRTFLVDGVVLRIALQMALQMVNLDTHDVSKIKQNKDFEASEPFLFTE